MQFDEFYKTIGVFGRYQKEKYFLICLTYMFPPIMVYSWSFSAATPSFSCQISNPGPMELQSLRTFIPTASQCQKDQNGISLRECQRCFQATNETGGLQPCRNFIFDRTYFQSTLVEEVKTYPEIFPSRKKNSFFFSVADGVRSCVAKELCTNCLLFWLYDWFVDLRDSI